MDWINGLFEFVGSILCWMNVVKLYNEKEIKGVYWPVTAFFASWGYWNIAYYSTLNQWASFWGGILMAIANTVWVVLAITYRRQANNGKDDLRV